MAFVPYKGVGNSVLIEATEAISAGDPVARATNGVAKTGDASQLFGVAATDIGSGELGVIWTKGVFTVPAAQWTGNIVMGTEVACGAGQIIDAGSGGNPVAGIVVEVDATTAAGGKLWITSDNANTI